MLNLRPFKLKGKLNKTNEKIPSNQDIAKQIFFPNLNYLMGSKF